MTELQQSNISWVNKDFQTIYPELIQEVSNITKARWDPSVSNQTDPGVVLLKELAIGLDKVNYVSDKNALEAFPLSVTQLGIARQLFQALGYYPHWYKSAQAVIQFLFKDKEKIPENAQKTDTVTVPRFTEITDTDGSYLYTTIDDCIIPLNQTYANVVALEGSLVSFDRGIVTEDLIDENNRLYLADYYIAENGIFISNIDANGNPSSDFWKKVDNLKSKTLGTSSDPTDPDFGKIFSFNLDPTNNQLYIEFPDNISSIIGDGLSVRYINSRGSQGNAPINILTVFSNTSEVGTLTVNNTSEDITLNSDNIDIKNIGLKAGGQDIEDIDSAWASYKRVQNTFETLVTVNDYTDAVFNLKDDQDTYLVSNDFVCDRTNDIQDSYKVMVTNGNISKLQTVTTNDGNFKPFNLKLYALQYNNLLNSPDGLAEKEAYENTFDIVEDVSITDLDSYIRNIIDRLSNYKCLSQDFIQIEQDKIALLKNEYIVDMTIIPTQVLSDLQEDDLTSTIRRALYNAFNARKMEFGSKVDYEYLTTVIKNCSTKIKYVSVANITYETHAIYRHNSDWFDIIISDECDSYNKGYINNGIPYHIKTSTGEYDDEYTLKELSQKNFFLDLDTQFIYSWNKESGQLDGYSMEAPNQNGISFRQFFRNDVLAKSILCGVTPIITEATDNFPYQLNQEGILYPDIVSISSNKTYNFDFTQDTNSAIAPIKDNEVLSFFRPSAKTNVSFSLGVAYCVARSSGDDFTILKDGLYELQPNEFLSIFYRKEGDDSTYIGNIYKYNNETPVVIQPTFALRSNNEQYNSIYYNIFNGRSYVEIAADSDAGKTIKSLPTLNATKSINLLTADETTITNKKNYWFAITKDIQRNTATNTDEYRFTFNTKAKTKTDTGDEVVYAARLLDEGEYFLYTNNNKNTLDIYGAGTLVVINNPADNITLTCPFLQSYQIQAKGLSAVSELWQTLEYQQPGIVGSFEITLKEQDYINIQPGGGVRFIPEEDNHALTLSIDSSGNMLETHADASIVEGSTTKSNLSFSSIYDPGSSVFPTLDQYIDFVFGALHNSELNTYDDLEVSVSAPDADTDYVEVVPADAFDVTENTAQILGYSNLYNIDNTFESGSIPDTTNFVAYAYRKYQDTLHALTDTTIPDTSIHTDVTVSGGISTIIIELSSDESNIEEILSIEVGTYENGQWINWQSVTATKTSPNTLTVNRIISATEGFRISYLTNAFVPIPNNQYTIDSITDMYGDNINNTDFDRASIIQLSIEPSSEYIDSGIKKIEIRSGSKQIKSIKNWKVGQDTAVDARDFTTVFNPVSINHFCSNTGNDKITFNFTLDWIVQPEMPIESLEGYSISYTDSYNPKNQYDNSENWQMLPKLSSTNFSWKAKSYLNIGLTLNTPQILDDADQSISIETKTSSTQEISGNSERPVYIYASNPMQLTGSPIAVETEYITAEGDSIYPSFYKYELLDTDSKSSSSILVFDKVDSQTNNQIASLQYSPSGELRIRNYFIPLGNDPVIVVPLAYNTDGDHTYWGPLVLSTSMTQAGYSTTGDYVGSCVSDGTYVDDIRKNRWYISPRNLWLQDADLGGFDANGNLQDVGRKVLDQFNTMGSAIYKNNNLYVTVPSYVRSTGSGFINLTNFTTVSSNIPNMIAQIVNTLGYKDIPLISKASIYRGSNPAEAFSNWLNDTSNPSNYWKFIFKDSMFTLDMTNYHQAVFAQVQYPDSEQSLYLFFKYRDMIGDRALTEAEKNINLQLVIPSFRGYEEINPLLKDEALNRFNTLNKDSNFDAFYQIPKNNLILNPLASDSFMNKKHPFNPFTICQISGIERRFLN